VLGAVRDRAAGGSAAGDRAASWRGARTLAARSGAGASGFERERDRDGSGFGEVLAAVGDELALAAAECIDQHEV